MAAAVCDRSEGYHSVVSEANADNQNLSLQAPLSGTARNMNIVPKPKHKYFLHPSHKKSDQYRAE